MSKIWVLAADAGQARLFTRDKKFSPLVETASLLHPESRLKAQELGRDRPGQVHESRAYGESPSEEPSNLKKREAANFAREIAGRLKAARARGEFSELLLVSEPSFLGLLREQLDTETRRLVTREVVSNITRESPEVIARTLDQAG